MKKKFLLLPLIGGFLLSGCKLELFGKTFYLFEKHEPAHVPGDTTVIDDVTPEDMVQHATKLTYASGSPSAPFYLKVGETKDIAVSLSPSPTLDDEKIVTWAVNKQGIVSYTVSEDDTKKITIVGEKAGTAKLTATNTYNTLLSYEFTINVIDYDEDNAYLWQYDSNDRAKFGYVNEEGKKAGTLEGDANLGGITWHYVRSSTESLQSSMGGIGFGKNEHPETSLHFEAENDRYIQRMLFEVASANAQAKMTVKIGGEIVLDEAEVSRPYYEVIGSTAFDVNPPLTGKIEIDVETPAYDSKQAATDPNYATPGAFYLKSMMFNYVEENFVSMDFALDSNHVVDYNAKANQSLSWEGMKLDKISERGVRVPIDIDAQKTAGKLTASEVDLATASHEAKEVELSFAYEEGKDPWKLKYNIHVRDENWEPTAMQVLGEMKPQELVAGDRVDYSGLTIKVTYDEDAQDFMILEFEDSETMTIEYGEGGNPFIADKALEEGYTITVKGLFAKKKVTRTAEFVVAANTLSVTDAIYDRIDYTLYSERSKIVKAGMNTSNNSISYKTGKDSRVRLDFVNAVKATRPSTSKDIVKVNNNVNLTVLDKTLCIKEVRVEMENMTKSTNKYRLFSSIYGGDIYAQQLAQLKSGVIEFSDFVEHVNNILLTPQTSTSASGLSSTYMALISIVVRYEESSHIEYTVSAGETTPTKLDYTEGEMFDPTGLTITLNETGTEKNFDITSYVKWYDGSTYETAPQETLLPTSTYVVGVFHDTTLKVNIGTVVAKVVSITKVSAFSDFVEGGKYYITCPEKKLIMKSSSANGDIFTGKGCATESDYAFNDKMDINILYENEYFEILPVGENKVTIKSANGYFGMTDGGNATCSAKNDGPKYKEFDVAFIDGVISLTITGEVTVKGETSEKTMYLRAGTNLIKPYDTNSDSGKIAIYKTVA